MPNYRLRKHYQIFSSFSIYFHLILCMLHPKSPSELWLSLRSSKQPPMVLRPSSVWPIIPCFIISACSLISLFLIPFPHAFHGSNIHCVSYSRPQSLLQTPNPFRSTLHRIPLVLFSFLCFVPKSMPISYDPDMSSLILIHSELHVCFLSLKST